MKIELNITEKYIYFLIKLEGIKFCHVDHTKQPSIIALLRDVCFINGRLYFSCSFICLTDVSDILQDQILSEYNIRNTFNFWNTVHAIRLFGQIVSGGV
jgi:hypothetical protein